MVFPTPENLTRTYDILIYANMITDYWIGNLLVIVIFFVSYIALKDFGGAKAYTTSMFFTTVMALLLRILGLTTEWTIWIGIFLTAIGIIFITGRD